MQYVIRQNLNIKVDNYKRGPRSVSAANQSDLEIIDLVASLKSYTRKALIKDRDDLNVRQGINHRDDFEQNIDLAVLERYYHHLLPSSHSLSVTHAHSVEPTRSVENAKVIKKLECCSVWGHRAARTRDPLFC